ncbi:BQ5605_C015g07808 [Microbotryum silenes-dioicae]|uniref:BQ5605_C015g07808 protein n=1 Tax=Microbotryum silenes-dioicae TaxID=796604 RepID=A0A2X0LWN3_9BASI|nr:BQ5605_C015g07808 [Microbotryum silenes-dioicae]
MGRPAAWTLRRSRPLIGSAPSVCINTPLLASMCKSLPNRGQRRCKDPFEALQLVISRLRLWAADDPVTIQEEDSSLGAAAAIGADSGTGLRRKELLNHDVGDESEGFGALNTAVRHCW